MPDSEKARQVGTDSLMEGFIKLVQILVFILKTAGGVTGEDFHLNNSSVAAG